jgi:DNA polymerase-3 subunit epsilon
MNHIYISIETTGINYSNNKIIEIAALKIDSKTKLRTLFHQYFNPEKELTPEVSGIVNLTNAFLKQCPKIKEKTEEFLLFIKSATLIMHNKEFVMSFLNKEMSSNLINNEIIDTLELARNRYPNDKNNLDFLFRALYLEKDVMKNCVNEVNLLPLLLDKIKDNNVINVN